MRIAIDARAVFWTGIGTYIRNLLRELAEINSSHTFIILAPREAMGRFQKEFSLPAAFSLYPVQGSYYSWKEQTVFVQELSRVQADLFHFTHFNVPLLFRRPYVVTIHDTTRFIFPGQRRQSLWQQIAYEAVFGQAVQRAKAVICVTEATKGELLNLPIRVSAPVKVVYEGVAERFFEPASALSRQKVRAMIGVNGPYLLYVGVWMSHKNLRRTLAAFQLVREKYPRLKFVITGKPVPGYTNIVSVVRELGLEDQVVFPGFVPSELLPALYAESAVLIFASLYEGFGLPPLEAAAAGAPVVTSNVSSLPEVMGAGSGTRTAEYVNPEDAADIAAGIVRVMEIRENRQTLIAAGRHRARSFSWRICAEQTLSVYESSIDANDANRYD